MYFFLMVFSGTGACQSNGVTEGSLWSFERAPSCMTFTSCFWFAVSDWNTALCFSTGSSISKRFSSWQKAGGKQKFWVSCSCFLSIQFQGHNIKEPKKIPNKELTETKYFFWPFSPQYHLKPTLEGRHFPLSINPAFERVFFACWRASRLRSLPCLSLGLLLHAEQRALCSFPEYDYILAISADLEEVNFPFSRMCFICSLQLINI